MRRMEARGAFLVAFVLVFACGSEPNPYCAEYVGPGGAGPGVPLCRELREQAVCDTAPDTARFERDGAGVARLVGGQYAICDDALEIVCPDRTALPRCIPDLDD